ncbi:MAG: VOC family protein [Firmicutes bacterium]|nr:VOC family protein [Bacillota bacterium]
MSKKRIPFIHHIELNVTDIKKSVAFYSPILKWLGFRRFVVRGWVSDNLLICIWRKTVKEKRLVDGAGLHHLAFGVETQEEVDAFYNEVLLKINGVKIKSPPKYCPEFKYNVYYATYFDDPDGNYLEVVYTDLISAKRYYSTYKSK